MKVKANDLLELDAYGFKENGLKYAKAKAKVSLRRKNAAKAKEARMKIAGFSGVFLVKDGSFTKHVVWGGEKFQKETKRDQNKKIRRLAFEEEEKGFKNAVYKRAAKAY